MTSPFERKTSQTGRKLNINFDLLNQIRNFCLILEILAFYQTVEKKKLTFTLC